MRCSSSLNWHKAENDRYHNFSRSVSRQTMLHWQLLVGRIVLARRTIAKNAVSST